MIRKLICFIAAAGATCGTLLAFDDTKVDVEKRLAAANTVFQEIMASPDKGIPQDLLERAHCVAIIPGLKRGAFIVGAKYGKGFLTCRTKGGASGWSAPANVRVEGGSFGFQIGGGETDAVLLVMSEQGANGLMRSEFKVGGEIAAMAGPIGRTAQASTDATMRAGILGYSLSRGIFGGVALEGSTLREDRDDNALLYGKEMTSEQIIRGGTVTTPEGAEPLMSQLNRYSFREK